MTELKNFDLQKTDQDPSFNPDLLIKGTLILEDDSFSPYSSELSYTDTAYDKKMDDELNIDNFIKGTIPNPDENDRIRIEVTIYEVLPKNNGGWTGEPGNSKWKPTLDFTPINKQTNPDNKSWEEILKKYGIDSIPFKDGEPDFSEISKGNVEIDDFTDDRPSNFSQADEKLAEQRGCTPEEVKQWREENKYTWHECNDCKTMQKIPREIHGNIPHSGGVSEYKKTHTNN